MKVEIWPDIIRPWCGLGDHRLDRALERFEHGADVEVIHCSFPLDPNLPSDAVLTPGQMLKQKHGLDDARIEAVIGQVEALAEQEGFTPKVRTSKGSAARSAAPCPALTTPMPDYARTHPREDFMSQADATKAKRPPVALLRAVNRLIRPLLASPLHGILSKRLMLLTYTGRKSGRHITIPIGYFEGDPGTVLAMSSTATWVANLRTGPTVRLRIRGRDHDAVPTVIQDTETFARFVEGSPGAAKIMGLSADRKPTPEELHAAAQKAHVVRFRLTTT